MFYLESCLSSSSASSRLDCKSILPKGTGLPWSAEWVSTMLAGAWYRVVFSKAYKMSKVIIRQRSKENSQIKEVDIEFDMGPNVQVCIIYNTIGLVLSVCIITYNTDANVVNGL